MRAPVVAVALEAIVWKLASAVTQNRPIEKAPETLTATSRLLGSVAMSNVLSEEKKQQVIAVGRLGWTLRRIEQSTGVRRETAGAYLKAAGITVRAPGGWGRRRPATAAPEAITDSSAAKPANEVTTDLSARAQAGPGGQTPEQQGAQPSSPPSSASDCEPYRETIELGLSRGRNAMAIWQDMVAGVLPGSGVTIFTILRLLPDLPQSPTFATFPITIQR